ncbi:MAG: DUF6263 family protein [Polyangiaceae bacterium]|nr:DUF6263 family protein [Polyangiaceae bacterium]
MRSLGRDARRTKAALAMVIVSLLACSACSKEEKKPVPQEESKASAVPSDMVVNDFLPSGSSSQGLAVKGVDGGFEAGLDGPSGGPDGSADTANAAGAPTVPTVKVIEPGSEPRAVRKYAFVANRVERRVFTVTQSVTAQGQVQQPPGLVMTIDVVAKEVKGTSARFEMKLVKVDLADKNKIDPRLAQAAAQHFATQIGTSATFDVTQRGEVGELSLGGNEKMQHEGAEEILGVFAQFVELVVQLLPDTAIGQGAKWERTDSANDHEPELQSKRTFELKNVNDAGGTILITTEEKVPKRAYPDPRMPGATIEIDGSGTATHTFRFDRIATKVVGEQVKHAKVEAPAGQDPTAGKKTIDEQGIKVKYALETPASK